ncbi:hypothetical protein NMG60_11033624 [Bertholletia excelsa]
MSRHRRQASRVLPPEIFSTDEDIKAANVNLGAEVRVSGHDAAGGTASALSATKKLAAAPSTNQQAPAPAPAAQPPTGRLPGL